MLCPVIHYASGFFKTIFPLYSLLSVPDLEKEKPYANPLARPPPNFPPSLERDGSVCLIDFNKGNDDDGCLKICNIMKWSATM